MYSCVTSSCKATVGHISFCIHHLQLVDSTKFKTIARVVETLCPWTCQPLTSVCNHRELSGCCAATVACDDLEEVAYDWRDKSDPEWNSSLWQCERVLTDRCRPCVQLPSLLCNRHILHCKMLNERITTHDNQSDHNETLITTIFYTNEPSHTTKQ